MENLATLTDLEGINAKASTDKHVITLITGDVVTVTNFADGKSVINVEPSDKTSGGSRILTVNEDTYVIPDQAMPYVASGKLDKDLFNITTLIADGYDDESQKTLPVIVQYSESNTRSRIAATPSTPKGAKKTHVLESINGAALSADKKETKKFWNDITQNIQLAESSNATFTPGIEKVWLDARVEATLEQSVKQIGAPTVWASGYDGKGVKVAVLDTGIDNEHPDFTGQIDEAKSFVPEEDVLDRHAHGTHVASTVLGTGAASEGRYKGVAPGARLLVGKVLNNEGHGLASWIIEGMEWAAHNAKIVSMSLGSSEPSDGTDPMAQAVNELSEETGALFVIAAGNTSGEGTIGSPGSADSALTVGAVDKKDNFAGFSSQGPRYGDMGLKPDLTAPGVAITAARSHLSTLKSGYYIAMTGTSMATPHVAGAAAILTQRHPDWKAKQLKDALLSTTKMLDIIKPYQGGTGRLDIAAAASSTIFATGSIDFGFFDWPHDEPAPVEKKVTYTNDSDSAVTLELSTTFKNQNGSDAPAGMLTLSTDKVTVPAKGSANVTISLDPKLGNFGSRYQGHLTAKVDGISVAHTSLGMIKEDEKYPLTIKAIDRDGSPNVAYVTLIGGNMKNPEVIGVNGTKELRLPPGTYSVMSMMDVDSDTDHAGVAIVGDPEINLNSPHTVELDARKANEIMANVEKDTEPTFRKMEYYRTIGKLKTNGAYILPTNIDKMYAVPTEEVKEGKFAMNTRWRLTEPELTMKFQGQVLDDIPQVGSTLLSGNHSLDVVYAGKGAPEDYTGIDVKDKAVVVDRSDEVSGPQRSQSALAAGAKLLITVNDAPRELSELVGIRNADNSISNYPLAVAAISGTEGEKLIAAARSGKLKLNVKGTPDPSYVYDLVDNHENAIPNDVTYSPNTEDLVRINAKYKSDRQAPGGEFRWDIPSYRSYGYGYLQRLSLPSVRTEWVSAQKGTSWYHQANVLDSNWEVRQPRATYKPGQVLDEEWFSTVVRPRFGEGYWKPYRGVNSLFLNVPAWADSGLGHTGGSEFGGQTLKLYQGSTLVKQGNGQALTPLIKHPTENTKYRLVSDAWRDGERWHTSVRTHTEWTFWSKKQEQSNTELPLLSLDYKVDTDMSGNGIAGGTTQLGLTVAQVRNAPGNGTIDGASLEVSFDEGQSWEKVDLVREGEGWVAHIKHPDKVGSSLSLRASAWDNAGNSITQEIIKAYELK